MIDWMTVSTAAMAAVTVGGVVIGVAQRMIRHTLRASFATIDQVVMVAGRLDAVERRIEQMPNSQSIQGFGVRLGGVEQNVAVARETISGVKEGLSRVEHMMGLLLEAELRKEEGAKS
jgi:hypothetical protein